MSARMFVVRMNETCERVVVVGVVVLGFGGMVKMRIWVDENGIEIENDLVVVAWSAAALFQVPEP